MQRYCHFLDTLGCVYIPFDSEAMYKGTPNYVSATLGCDVTESWWDVIACMLFKDCWGNVKICPYLFGCHYNILVMLYCGLHT